MFSLFLSSQTILLLSSKPRIISWLLQLLWWPPVCERILSVPSRGPTRQRLLCVFCGGIWQSLDYWAKATVSEGWTPSVVSTTDAPRPKGLTVLWWNGNINETPLHSTTFQVCAQITILVIRTALLASTTQLRLTCSIAIQLLWPVFREAEGRCNIPTSLQPKKIFQLPKGETMNVYVCVSIIGIIF